MQIILPWRHDCICISDWKKYRDRRSMFRQFAILKGSDQSWEIERSRASRRTKSFWPNSWTRTHCICIYDWKQSRHVSPVPRPMFGNFFDQIFLSTARHLGEGKFGHKSCWKNSRGWCGVCFTSSQRFGKLGPTILGRLSAVGHLGEGNSCHKGRLGQTHTPEPRNCSHVYARTEQQSQR